ncbi:MAG: ribokinase [Bacilli bacterium]
MFKDIKVAIIGLSGQSIFLNVDEFHKPGETITAKELFIEPGGKGYNQAACLLKLGARVSYLSSIGDDSYGKVCFDYLNQQKAKLYFKKTQSKTALATILTNRDGDNQVTVFRGASEKINLNHLNDFKKEIISSDILLLTLEPNLEVVEEAIKIAKANGVMVILNPAPFNKEFKLYDMCDVIIPNEIEAKDIFGLSPTSDFKKEIDNVIKTTYFKENFKKVIITIGNKGSLLIDNEETFHINGLKVNTIDTTGAGDVFNASFAYFYANTNDLKIAAHYANIAAAVSTTQKHVLNSLPSLEEILSYKQI